METTISIVFFILAVVAYTLKELAAHGKIKWSHGNVGFWDSMSYMRKYKWVISQDEFKSVSRIPAPDKWYYRFFKISAVERFPGSATIFVFLTDGMHFSQTFFKLFLCASIASYKPILGWYDAILYWTIFGITFTLSYRSFSK